MVGHSVSHYRLVETQGEGRMGVVHEAEADEFGALARMRRMLLNVKRRAERPKGDCGA